MVESLCEGPSTKGESHHPRLEVNSRWSRLENDELLDGADHRDVAINRSAIPVPNDSGSIRTRPRDLGDRQAL
jgi:hypothetical protein